MKIDGFLGITPKAVQRERVRAQISYSGSTPAATLEPPRATPSLAAR